MRPDLHLHLVPKPLHKGSGGGVADGKDPLVNTRALGLTYVLNLPASVSGMKALSSSLPDLGRLKVSLLPFASDALSPNTSPILSPEAGLELGHQPVSRLSAPVDDLIDHFLADDLPLFHSGSAKGFREKGITAGIGHRRMGALCQPIDIDFGSDRHYIRK